MNDIFYIEYAKICSPIVDSALRFWFKYLPEIKRFLIRLKLFIFILSPATIGGLGFFLKKTVQQLLVILDHWRLFCMCHNYLFFF